MRNKIVDEDEVLRWFATGRTYPWMQAEYERRYGIVTSPSLWSQFRIRRGLERRTGQDVTALVPWQVDERHRWAALVVMLRDEERRRAGRTLPATSHQRLLRWRRQLERDGMVVAYDPSTQEGFGLVPRGPHDTDLVRAPPGVPAGAVAVDDPQGDPPPDTSRRASQPASDPPVGTSPAGLR